MWRVCIVAAVLGLLACGAAAQSAEELEAVMLLTGCGQPEDLDGYEVERLCHFIEHPVRINSVSVAFLRSCGLFTPYQAVTLADYRMRHGDVMSIAELSSIDGFGPEKVRALIPFISLHGGQVGERQSRVENDLAVKVGTAVSDGSPAGGYGLKYRCLSEGRGSAALSFSRANGNSLGLPEAWSGHLAWEMKKLPLRLMAGDFNARFGQGLALWNGFSMSGAGKTDSFFRSSSGLSSSWSFTGSSALTGISSELSVSRVRLSALVALPGIKDGRASDIGLLPAANVGWYGRNMSASLTHYAEFARSSGGAFIPDMKTSVDVAMCLSGTDLFGEVAYDWVNMKVAFLAGTVFPCGEQVRTAVHLRCYPSGFEPSRSAAVRSGTKCSNEHAVSLSSDYRQKSGRIAAGLSLDVSYRPVPQSGTVNQLQLKVLSDCSVEFSDSFQLKFRLSERLRTWGQKSRTDVRADAVWTWNRIVLSSRINLLRCKGTGLLGYAEGGYKADNVSAYLRAGIYRTLEN